MLEYIVLGMLLNKPVTGYEIKKGIEDGVGYFYKASFGSLYPLLDRLTKKGYLSMVEKTEGKRAKKYYEILPAGEKVFFEWLSEPIRHKEGSDHHLAKIYFFDRLDQSVREPLLLKYEQNNVEYLQELKRLSKKFEQLEHPECFYYKLSTLYYGIAVVQQVILWCQHIRLQKPLKQLINEEDK